MLHVWQQTKRVVLHCRCPGRSSEGERPAMAPASNVSSESGLHPRQRSSLALACGAGYPNVLEKLLSEEEEVISPADGMGWTDLHFWHLAGQAGILSAVTDLLQRQSVRVNAAAKDGRTALFLACQNGKQAVALTLLAHGARNTADVNGVTPLDVAAARGLCGVVLRILRGKPVPAAAPWSRWTPLHWAAVCGRRQVVRQLVQHGMEVDAIAQGGLTPLHIASALGHVNVVQELVESDADVSIRCARDWTALQYAMEGDWVFVTDYILELSEERTAPRPAARALRRATPSSGDRRQRGQQQQQEGEEEAGEDDVTPPADGPGSPPRKRHCPGLQ